MLTYQQEFEIRCKALELLRECKINLRRPIDIDRIIENSSMSIVHLNRNLSGLLGFSCYDMDSDTYLVVTDIRENSSYERYRFTLCHEIGHIILGHLNIDTAGTFIIRDYEKERAASVFADELLMPTIRCIHLNLDTPQKLQDYFGVSMEAARNKVKFLEQNTMYVEYMQSELLGLIRKGTV